MGPKKLHQILPYSGSSWWHMYQEKCFIFFQIAFYCFIYTRLTIDKMATSSACDRIWVLIVFRSPTSLWMAYSFPVSTSCDFSFSHILFSYSILEFKCFVKGIYEDEAGFSFSEDKWVTKKISVGLFVLYV